MDQSAATAPSALPLHSTTTYPPSPFALSRLSSPSLFPSLVAAAYRTFVNERTQDIYMGPDTPAGHAAFAARLARVNGSDPSDHWIVVVDTENNDAIVAAANWKIRPGKVPGDDLDAYFEDRQQAWMLDEGVGEERREVARARLQAVLEERAKYMTAPHVQLAICFTDPAYARRGAGAMMMQWGVQLADLLQLPTWIQASPAGRKLYEAFGFEALDIGDGAASAGSALMLRPARTEAVKGGKVAPILGGASHASRTG